VRVAVHVHQHTAAGLDDARHLADALRHVGKQHDAELRSGHIEAVVVQLERVAVHDTGLDVEPLLERTRPEQLEHDGRLVRRQYLCADACRRDAQGTAASRHVQKSHARTELGTAEAFVPQPDLRGGVGFVIAFRDVVPRGPRIFSFVSYGFLL